MAVTAEEFSKLRMSLGGSSRIALESDFLALGLGGLEVWVWESWGEGFWCFVAGRLEV